MYCKSKSRLILFAVGVMFACSQNRQQTLQPASELIAPPKKLETLFGNDFILDDQHSYLGFRIKYFGSADVRGRFDKFKGIVMYDSMSGFLSTTALIQTNSINTGEKRRDEDLKEESWFGSDKYPYIKFESSGISTNKDSLFLSGNLSIKGITQPVQIRLEKLRLSGRDWAGNDQLEITGSCTLNRKDFGIKGEGFWNEIMENGISQLEDNVLIELEIHARKSNYTFRSERPDLIDSLALVLLKQSETMDPELWMQTVNKVQAFNTVYDLGQLLMSRKNYEAAVDIFKLESQLFPERINDQNHLCVTYLLKGEREMAIGCFRQVMEKDSVNVRASQYLRILN
ncbi:MAG: YceI family protein [Cyclobacteriaceae bacterium]